MLMEIFMKEAGLMIEQMEQEPTLILMEPNMKDSGKMINKTA
jgi:hypothetical protein